MKFALELLTGVLVLFSTTNAIMEDFGKNLLAIDSFCIKVNPILNLIPLSKMWFLI